MNSFARIEKAAGKLTLKIGEKLFTENQHRANG